MGGILDGIGDIFERHLGIAGIKTRSACSELSEAPPPGFDAASLIEDILAQIEANSNPARKPSTQNWRSEKKRWIDPNNPSREKQLEKAIARLTGDEWANQVPTASGLVNATNDRHRNLDLVYQFERDRFEFIELKFKSDTPLYAAMEMLQYGALYIFYRLNYPQTDAQRSPLLAARSVHLRVLAPAAYYQKFRLDWLETALTAGLQTAIAQRIGLPLEMDFRFTVFPDNFEWPCSNDVLLAALDGRGPVKWAGDGDIANLSEATAEMMRDRQLDWAQAGGIPAGALQDRPSWVLKPEHREFNMFRPEWWDHIRGKEDRTHHLNSSQCLAVNLFAPLADDPARARAALQILLPERGLDAGDTVAVRFEFTPEGAPEWLGEREKQRTQIDVFFEVIRSGRCFGHLLVEVKFSENSFGRCRGWNSRKDGTWSNPNRSRCLDVSSVLSSPRTNCWLAEVKGRRYWEIIAQPSSSIRVDAIKGVGACPFRHGLYQMMRNRVLADELVRRTEAAWADFAVCRHRANSKVVVLDEPVSSKSNAIEAFRALSSNDAVRDWNADDVVTAIRSTDDRLAEWENWMRGRYFG